MIARAALEWLFATAFILRLAYVLWAPDVLYGDPIFYSLYADMIVAGHGFSEFDRSPAVFWMPGWPALLALFYSVLGKSVRVAMLLNAVMGAATCVVLADLCARLLGARDPAPKVARASQVALLAGFVYACWPGNIYYCGVLMSEVVFNFVLVSALWVQVVALAGNAICARVPRALLSLLAGVVFGAAAMIKAEPLVLVPVLLTQALLLVPRREAALHAVWWLLGIALLLGPWTLRNHGHFGQWIVTSASGGTNFWIGNHEGGNGGNELGHEEAFRLANRRETSAATNLAQSAAGWREGLDYWRTQPGAALRTLPNKLWLTYRSDGGGVRNLARDEVSRPVRKRLRSVADFYWFAVLALAALGIVAARGWPPAALALVLGIPAAWFCVHLVFIGGERFHVPETPMLAMLAAAGALHLRDRFA